MTDKPYDGGPAFPTSFNKETVFSTDGMSLRDYFAGQALSGICASGPIIEPAETCAYAAYAMADAMLAERKVIKK